MARPRSSDPFDIVVERSGDLAVLRVSGELVAEHEERMEESVGQVVAAGASEVLIDLRGVSFIDSLGVRALIRNQLRSRAGGFSLAVVPGRGQVFRVVKTMGLDRVLHVLDDGAAGFSPSAT
jgi:anti-sigma B factor antagonist